MSLAEAVDGLYCHTAVKVSSFGHNVLASNPQLTNTH
jgi:hypothetical protein